MKLICGLGNPGEKYYGTRHNVGFAVCDILSKRHNMSFSGKRFQGRFTTGTVQGQKVGLIKPSTYMNRSGLAVSAAFHFYKLLPDDLVVIHDDLDLEFGRILVKQGGGTAGHKGLASIVRELGSADFFRVRIGIGRPDVPHVDISNYVLRPFSLEEKETISGRLEVAADAVEKIFLDGAVAAMNEFNARNRC